jgi:uncharacterized protein DUF1553/uncharacterized protein DUF1549
MSRKQQHRLWLIGLAALILAIPFLPRAGSWSGLLLAQSEQEEQEAAPPQSDVPAAGDAEPLCTFFTSAEQAAVRGPSFLERIGSPEASIQKMSDLSAQTEDVARALAPVAGLKQPNAMGPWVSRIDSHIFTVLAQKNIQPAPLTTDAEFLRRVTLDLTGKIPTSAQTQQFTADSDPQKRSKAIDRLLNSPEWVDRWTMWLGDLIHNNSVSTQINRGTPGRDALYQFIRDSVQNNKPYNQFATELITGTGDSYTNGPADFILGGTMSMGPVQDTYDRQWVQAATMFLGLKNFDCLLCHNGEGHLDAVNLWASQVKRSEAWGMAAFYSRARITRPAGATWNVAEATTGGYNLNTTSGNRPTRAPIDGLRSPVLPKYLFTGHQLTTTDNFRVALAKDLTHDLQFARATMNYLWAHFFGIGIVDPPDAFDLARLDPRNPPPDPWTLQPSNPELLDELAREFVNQGYDLKEMMRQICNSQAYQLSSRYDGAWDSSYTRYYARHLIQRLDSEEMADAIVQSSGVANNMTVARGSGTNDTIPWAMQLPETIVPGGAVGTFLNTFLRGDRDENTRRTDLSTSQALSLMNDTFVVNRVQSTAGWLNATVTATPNNTQLVTAIYLQTLSRPPTSSELTTALQKFQSGTRLSNAQDLLWALYNKVDFIFNY